MDDAKKLIKIASHIQQAYVKMQHLRYLEILNQLRNFAGILQEFTGESKRLGASLVHSWFYAAENCSRGIARLTCDISDHISQIKELVDNNTEEAPKLSAIFEELRQLQQEFGKIDYNKAEQTISVITEPITLEDTYLGPFKIQLHLKKLSELYKGSPYYCIALDPHPASTNEDVTHPHVSGDKLCEGEGSVVIRTALEEGRLCDFFTLVRSILNTYSPDSPYVSLSEWEGIACYDCGYVMDSDNSYYCNFCDNSYCEECTTCCFYCEETVCLSCLQSCSYCEEKVCPNCISRCAECGSSCCKSCLDDGICPNCVARKK